MEINNWQVGDTVQLIESIDNLIPLQFRIGVIKAKIPAGIITRRIRVKFNPIPKEYKKVNILVKLRMKDYEKFTSVSIWRKVDARK